MKLTAAATAQSDSMNRRRRWSRDDAGNDAEVPASSQWFIAHYPISEFSQPKFSVRKTCLPTCGRQRPCGCQRRRWCLPRFMPSGCRLQSRLRSEPEQAVQHLSLSSPLCLGEQTASAHV